MTTRFYRPVPELPHFRDEGAERADLDFRISTQFTFGKTGNDDIAVNINPMAQVNMSCIKSLPEVCRLGIARVGIRTLLLVLFTCVMQHTAVLLGNSSTLNKRGENPPRCNRTTPADFSLANSTVYAQTIFSFSAVMVFHEALITSSFSCTIFSDMVYRLFSEWCVATSFYRKCLIITHLQNYGGPG